MTHQVNLKAAHLLPGFGPLQIGTFLVCLLATVTACLLWFVAQWWERQNLIAETTALENLLSNKQAMVNDLKESMPNLAIEPELLAENERLNIQLEQVNQTLSGLAGRIENSFGGFHQPLLQLSSYDLDGLWLSKIRMQDGTDFFELDGYTRAPDLVPRYISQLGKAGFSGLTVRTLEVKKAEDANLWRFTLSNRSME